MVSLGSLWIPMLLLVHLAIQSPIWNFGITGPKKKIIAATKAFCKKFANGTNLPTNFEPDQECCICQHLMQPEEELHEIKSCKHYFHTQCLLGWTENSCPICRGPRNHKGDWPTPPHARPASEPSSPVSPEPSYSGTHSPQSAASQDGDFPVYDPTDAGWYTDNDVPVSSHQSPPRGQTTYDNSQAIELGTPSIFPPFEQDGYGQASHVGPYHGEARGPPPIWLAQPPPLNYWPPQPPRRELQEILRNLPPPAGLPIMLPYEQHLPLPYPPPVSGPPPGDFLYSTPIENNYYVPQDASHEGGLWHSINNIFPR